MKKLVLSTIVVAGIGIGIYFSITKPLPGFEDAWKFRVLSFFQCFNDLAIWLAESGVISWSTFVTFARTVLERACRNHKLWTSYERSTILGVPVLIFRPERKPRDKKSEALPGVVYFHSGGFMLYPKGCSSSLCSRIASKVNAVVISVEYSLSPEARCPAAFDESFAVAQYILKHPSEFGIDGSRVSVMGASAGGGIAVSVAYRLAKEPSTAGLLKLQVAINPLLQLFTVNLTSFHEGEQGPRLVGRRMCCAFSSAFLTGGFDHVDSICKGLHTQHLKNTFYDPFFETKSRTSDNSNLSVDVTSEYFPLNALQNMMNPLLFPFWAKNFSRVAPLYLVTSEYDGLRDESLFFTSLWRKYGGILEHKHYMTFHTAIVVCDHILCSNAGQKSVDELLNYLEQNL